MDKTERCLAIMITVLVAFVLDFIVIGILNAIMQVSVAVGICIIIAATAYLVYPKVIKFLN